MVINMDEKRIEEYVCGIKAEIAPATGCTEPAAVALCVSAATRVLGSSPEKITVNVSEYIFKNAMNVGIPGVDAIGLNMAVALGAICSKPEKLLLVLSDLSDEEKSLAKGLLEENRIVINIASDSPKIYIQAVAEGGGHIGKAVIENGHSNFVSVSLDSEVLYRGDRDGTSAIGTLEEKAYTRTVAEIWEFVKEVDSGRLNFLNELIRLNHEMSHEGLENCYGLQVGKNILGSSKAGLVSDDISNYAVSVTAAAADARMSGCEKSVMSVGGSGNQGLTATLPLIAIGEKIGCSEEVLYKSLALSILVTVHVKHYIGRLSVLCGCSIAAAIGVAAAIVFMLSGSLQQAEQAINTMVADISGVVCDGAKPGCALKIATSVSSAVRAASLAISNLGASGHDGIVNSDVEISLKNLGTLGNEGMNNTNQAILRMVLNKKA